MTNQVMSGSDLMIFIQNGTGVTNMTSIAYATSCSIETSAETTATTSKDHTGKWGTSTVKLFNWTASSEHLYADKQSNGFDLLFAAYTKATPISIFFTIKSGATMTADTWTKGEGGYKGEVIITSLSISAPDGDNATFSCSMTGNGPLIKVTA